MPRGGVVWTSRGGAPRRDFALGELIARSRAGVRQAQQLTTPQAHHPTSSKQPPCPRHKQRAPLPAAPAPAARPGALQRPRLHGGAVRAVGVGTPHARPPLNAAQENVNRPLLAQRVQRARPVVLLLSPAPAPIPSAALAPAPTFSAGAHLFRSRSTHTHTHKNVESCNPRRSPPGMRCCGAASTRWRRALKMHASRSPSPAPAPSALYPSQWRCGSDMRASHTEP